MPIINKTEIVPYTQIEMYDLVNDINAYPKFVPWCVSSRVTEHSEDEVHATLAFARGGLTKSFTTLNRLQPHKMVEIRLVNGPFKHLEGFWRFEVVKNDQCKIALDLEFEFSTRFWAVMFGPIFHQVAIRLVDAFCERAKIVYGDNK